MQRLRHAEEKNANRVLEEDSSERVAVIVVGSSPNRFSRARAMALS